MKVIKVTKALAGLVAGILVSATAVQAKPTMMVSVHHGSGGTVGVEVSAVEGYSDAGALLTNFRATRLNNDSYLRTFELSYGHKFTENFAATVGVGAILTDYSSSMQLDSLRPTVNVGAAVNIGGYTPAITAYIFDAQNYGAKATLPLYMHGFKNNTNLTFGIYAEANRIEVEKQGEFSSTMDDEIVRNVGLQASLSF